MAHQQKQRLSGIDLVRGLAAYAVIQVHSGDETWGIPVEPSAIAFRLLFYFAVPFFLAASFFFSTRKIANSTSWSFWKTKIARILIPYAVWSLLYLVIRAVFFTLTHELAKFQLLFSDPLSIIFFGGASYQLYFLPLLFTGTFSLLLAHYLERHKISPKVSIVLAVVSLFVETGLVISGNDFKLGPNVAFEGLVSFITPGANQNNFIRFLLIQISWLVKCLPYMFIAMILNRWLHRSGILRLSNLPTSILFSVSFLIINVLKSYVLPGGLSDILVAYLLLLTGISISKYLGDNQIWQSLGSCSFGIYLIHPIVMNLVKPFVHKIFPASLTQISILSMLAICIPCFIFSWLIVSFLRQKQQIAQYLFGEM